MSRLSYAETVESLIARGILSPGARGMASDDVMFQLRQAGPRWAYDMLARAWKRETPNP